MEDVEEEKEETKLIDTTIPRNRNPFITRKECQERGDVFGNQKLDKKLITRHPMISRFFRRGKPVMIPAFNMMRARKSKRSFSYNKREEPDFTFEEEGLIYTRRSRSA